MKTLKKTHERRTSLIEGKGNFNVSVHPILRSENSLGGEIPFISISQQIKEIIQQKFAQIKIDRNDLRAAPVQKTTA